MKQLKPLSSILSNLLRNISYNYPGNRILAHIIILACIL